MKFFTNKSIWSKIILVLAFILLFQFILSNQVVLADDGTGSAIESILIKPIISLFVGLGDAAMGLMHSTIMGQDASIVPIDLTADWFDLFAQVVRIVLGVVLAVIAVAIAYVTAGGGLPVAAMVGKAAVTLIATVVITNVPIVSDVINEGLADELNEAGVKVSISAYSEEALPATLELPLYTYSAEEIFKGKILLFDVNFFSNDGRHTIYEKIENVQGTNNGGHHNPTNTDPDGDGVNEIDENGNPIIPELSQENNKENNDKNNNEEAKSEPVVTGYYYIDYVEDENGNKVKMEIPTSKQNLAVELGSTISKWYVALRNICLVLMMIVLLYVGIRMMLSTLASDKAKYRQLLQDWLMGMLLLFMLHYLMAFSVAIVEDLTNVVSTSLDKNMVLDFIPNDSNDKLRDYVEDENGANSLELKQMAVNEKGEALYDEAGNRTDASDDTFYLAYTGNYLGHARIRLQMADDTAESIGYGILFVIMVLLTGYFTFVYLKRSIYLIFLTLIAPLVALTYPIDRMNDGSAQGFNRWFKEYIFNLLLQPLHLLLYFILVGTAFDLASQNYIYTTVAIAFMIPAEKLLRSLFGFEKAQTSGMLSAAAGGALAMTAIKSLGNLGRRRMHGEPKGRLESGNQTDDDNGKINFGTGSIDNEQEILDEIGQGKTPIRENKNVGNALKEARKETNNVSELSVATLTADKIGKNIKPDENLAATNKKKDQKFKNMRQFAANQRRELGAYYGPKWARRKVKIKNAARRLPGKAIRFTGKAFGAATLATGGAIIGAAGGDPSNALSYALTGAGAGYYVGGRATEAMTSNIDRDMKIENPDAAYRRALQQSKNDQYNLERQARELEKELKERLSYNGFSEKDIDKFVEDKKAEEYVNYGVNDADDIVRCETLQRDYGRSFKASIVANKNYKKIGADLGTPKEKDWKEKYKNDFMTKKKVSEDVAERASIEAMNMIQEADKVNKKMRKY